MSVLLDAISRAMALNVVVENWTVGGIVPANKKWRDKDA